jgi:hypothetical protein
MSLTTILIILLVLFLVGGVGGGYGGWYGTGAGHYPYSIGIGGVILIVVLFLVFARGGV